MVFTTRKNRAAEQREPHEQPVALQAARLFVAIARPNRGGHAARATPTP
jgi:hypothetical protein